jgi:hypothetical protein
MVLALHRLTAEACHADVCAFVLSATLAAPALADAADENLKREGIELHMPTTSTSRMVRRDRRAVSTGGRRRVCYLAAFHQDVFGFRFSARRF